MRRVIVAGFVAAGLVVAHGLYADEIHDAVEGGNQVKVRAIVAKDRSSVNASTKEGMTPLHLAAGRNDAQMTTLLISLGADVNATNDEGFTPLHWAAQLDSDRAGQALLKNGANIDAKTKEGLTPIDVAISRRSENVIKFIAGVVKSFNAASPFEARYKDGEKAYLAAIEFRSKNEMEKANAMLQQAYAIFTDLLLDNPTNSRVNYAYGMTCLDMKEFARARMRFEAILMTNENDDSARLALARTYVASGQYEEAQKHFRIVLARARQPQLRERIQQYLDRLEKSVVKSAFSARIDVGWFSDDNINTGPDSRTISIAPVYLGTLVFSELSLASNSLPLKTAGFFSSLSLSASYDGGDRGGWVGFADLVGYKNIVDEGTAYESAYYQLQGGLRLTEEDRMIQVPAKVSIIQYGGAPLMNSYGIAPAFVAVGAGNQSQWITSLTLEKRDYDTLTDRNSVYFQVSETMKYYFATDEKTRHSVLLGVNLSRDSTSATVYQYTGVGWLFGGDLSIPWWQGGRIYAKLGYSTLDYADREVLAPDKRKDTQTQAVIGYGQSIAGNLGIDVNHQMARNSSTFALYTYEKNVTTISLSYVF